MPHAQSASVLQFGDARRLCLDEGARGLTRVIVDPSIMRNRKKLLARQRREEPTRQARRAFWIGGERTANHRSVLKLAVGDDLQNRADRPHL